MHRSIRDLLIVAGLLIVAAPASALYVETPLLLRASAEEADVGDTVSFEIEPTNASVAQTWAGKLVRAYLSYDTGPVGEEGSGGEYAHVALGEAFHLDQDARGRFHWTVPSELDDKNVGILIEAEDGTLLATGDVRVGDAPHVMRITGGGEEPLAEGQSRGSSGDDNASASGQAARAIPMAPLLGFGAVALAAIALRRRL